MIKMKNILTHLSNFVSISLQWDKRQSFIKQLMQMQYYLLMEHWKIILQKIRYPVDAIENNLMGTYIGCIRLDANGRINQYFLL